MEARLKRISSGRGGVQRSSTVSPEAGARERGRAGDEAWCSSGLRGDTRPHGAVQAPGCGMMLFRVLGPLEVDVGNGPVPLGGPKQRAVLAQIGRASCRE